MIYTVTLNPGLDRTVEVDFIEFNTVLRARGVRLDWGGKGLNVSRALKALGMESTAMGFLGGETGRQLERGLLEAGIHTDFIWIEGETRTNLVIQETLGHGGFSSGQEKSGASFEGEMKDQSILRHIKVNEPGPLVHEQYQQALLRKIAKTAQVGDWWVFCGSLPPGVPADFYAHLIRQAADRGARTALDTSGEALRLGCAARPFLVKPNRLEAEELVGFSLEEEEDLRKAAFCLRNFGICVVAISLSKDGLWLASSAGAVHAYPPEVAAGGAAVGAGDALLAGLIWALEHGWGLDETARWAVAAGTAAALRPGVEMGTLEEVEQIFHQTRVKTTGYSELSTGNFSEGEK